MHDDLTRRGFLGMSLATAAIGTGSLVRAAEPSEGPSLTPPSPTKTKTKSPPPEAQKLSVYQFGPQVWIRWNNQLLTSYRAHPTQKYPYLYPLAGPVTGLSLTTESSVPFPHHRSLLFACDHVNEGNYWQGDVTAGQVVSQGPKLGTCTPESAEIVDQCEWAPPGKPVVLRDQRKITISVPSPNLRFIDTEIVWAAVQDVKVTKTNHALFAVRAAMDITPFGNGTLVNSNGAEGEAATFGKEAGWCTYYGKRNGETVEGLALFDHPKNPWSPSRWFTRDYGFISPTPFNFIEKPWELPAGNSVSLRYRVVLYVGDPKEAELDRLFQQWAS